MSESIESILVDVVWPVDSTITVRISTSIIRATLGKWACDISTSCKINSGSRSSTWIRCVYLVVVAVPFGEFVFAENLVEDVQEEEGK